MTPGGEKLSPRQREIAEMVSRGFQDKEIACELRISEETVGHHLRRAFAKLGVHSRVELVMVVFAPAVREAAAV